MGHESLLGNIIQDEGLHAPPLPTYILKSNDVINSAIDLFHSILEDDDPRWAIASAWQEVERYAQVQRIHKEASMSAIHLSEKPSFRNGYSQFSREPNIRQICRAIYNLSAWPSLEGLHQDFPQVTHPHWFTKIARTSRILRGTDKTGVTGCPEALYQLQMWEHHNNSEQYIGRIGFNLHLENTVPILSVTNLQGIPNGMDQYQRFFDTHGIPVFNVLLQNTKAFVRRYAPDTEIRGLRNPRIENPELLNTVLMSESIPRYSFHRE